MNSVNSINSARSIYSHGSKHMEDKQIFSHRTLAHNQGKSTITAKETIKNANKETKKTKKTRRFLTELSVQKNN